MVGRRSLVLPIFGRSRTLAKWSWPAGPRSNNFKLCWASSKQEWNMDLANKRIVVLGGTSGIGFAVAQKAADQGSAVVVASSKEDNVNRAKRALSGAAEGVTLDLTSE